MSIVIRCDTCSERLSEDVSSVYLAVGAIALNRGTEAHFIGSERPTEYVLCARCTAYLDRCVRAIVTKAEASATC